MLERYDTVMDELSIEDPSRTLIHLTNPNPHTLFSSFFRSFQFPVSLLYDAGYHVPRSVNFPTSILTPLREGTARLCIVNVNQPGSLGEITTTLGSLNINITQQLNRSRENVAYTVVDYETPTDSGFDHASIQDAIAAIPSVISSRVIDGRNEGPSNFRN